MSYKWEVFRTIRGVEIRVIAEDFDTYARISIGYAPEQISAETLDGVPFPLSNEEESVLIAQAVTAFTEDPT